MSIVRLNELTAPPEGAPTHLDGVCDEHGEYSVEAFYLSGELRNPDPSCPRCVILESKREAEATFRSDQQSQIDTMVERSGIEPKMRKCKVNNYAPTNQQATHNRDRCKAYIQGWQDDSSENSNIIMIGNVGTGKTHLSCAVAQAVIRQHGKQAIYTRADDLASYVRDSYNSGTSYTESQALRRFGEVPLLVVDELGANPAKDHERSLLSRVIDKRWSNELPTIAMSNLTVSELKEATDARMMSRLLQGAEVLVFDWEDYRDRGQG